MKWENFFLTSFYCMVLAIVGACDSATQPRTTEQPIEPPQNPIPSRLSEFMPFEVGTEFTYRVRIDSRNTAPKDCTMQCIDSATIGAERLGLFSALREGKEPSRIGIVECPPRIWFVSLPVSEKTKQARALLQKLGPSLREAKDIQGIKDKEGIRVIGFLHPSTVPSERKADGTFAVLGAKYFGMDPFAPLPKPLPEISGRFGFRRGRAILQRNVGLLHLHTFDHTRHGHSLEASMIDYKPTSSNWPLPVDLSMSHRERRGNWEYRVLITPLSGGSRMVGVALTSIPETPRSRRPQTPTIVTPWGLFDNKQGGFVRSPQNK